MSWLLIATAAAQPAADAPLDYRGYLDQARFFIKRGWNADAEEQLARASRHPDGRVDPEVWFLLAQVRYELADLPGAREAASQALTWSRDEEQARSTREWLDFLDRRFGTVQLVPPGPGLSARVQLELRGTILDPELKTWLARAQARLEEPVDLPMSLGLPAGYTYAVNGEELQVLAGETTAVAVAVRRVLLQSTEVQLSAGVSSWARPELANLFPAPAGELGVVVPMGPLVAGIRVGLVLQPRETPDGDVSAAPGHAAGIELGLQDPRDDAVQLRLGGSIRHLSLPGLRVGCSPAMDPECLLFSDRGDPVEVRSAAIAPGIWTSATLLDRTRSTSVGVGLRLAAERAMGRVQQDATPLSADRSTPRLTLGEPAPWQAWGIRVLVDVSWAL